MYNALYSLDHRAGPLTKNDLQFRYTPPPGTFDDPKLRGEPDRSLLNRSQWYEMLYFINKFANNYGNRDRNIALKAERLIKTTVPGHLRSHDNIEQWLLQNWKLYPFV